MDNQQKQNISLILMCIICSVLISLLVTSTLIHTSGINQTTNQNQTTNVNAYESELEKIDINIATINELKTLPGVGETIAQRIIDNRPYNDIWEIADVDGIGSKTIQQIINRIEVK